MLKVQIARKVARPPKIGIGSEVTVKTTYRRYYAIVLRFNLALHKVEVCLYDDILSCWSTYWFDLRRVSAYVHNAKAAVAAEAATAA